MFVRMLLFCGVFCMHNGDALLSCLHCLTWACNSMLHAIVQRITD